MRHGGVAESTTLIFYACMCQVENPGSGSVEENYRLETEYWQLCVQSDLLYFLAIFSNLGPIGQIKSRNTPEVEFLDISLTKDLSLCPETLTKSVLQEFYHRSICYRSILVRHLIRAENTVQFSQSFLLVLKQKTDQYKIKIPRKT